MDPDVKIKMFEILLKKSIPVTQFSFKKLLCLKSFHYSKLQCLLERECSQNLHNSCLCYTLNLHFRMYYTKLSTAIMLSTRKDVLQPQHVYLVSSHSMCPVLYSKEVQRNVSDISFRKKIMKIVKLLFCTIVT